MKEKHPPRWALSLLELVCKDRYLEQIEGDLYELFHRDHTHRFAKWKFGYNTLRFIRLRYLKGVDDYRGLILIAMIKNYLKVAIRSLLKQKTYAGINIVGLSIGLASCLLIAMYILHERSYDRFYPEGELIYRVLNGERGPYTPPLLAETIPKEIPEVEVATRISGLFTAYIKVGERGFKEEKGAYGDASTFQTFQTEFLAGTPETALSEPNNIVLTASLAKKYFPNDVALNQTLKLDGETYKVAAVVVDQPKNTHFPYSFVAAQLESQYTNWTGNSYWTYVKLLSEANTKTVNTKLKQLYEKYVGPDLIGYTGHATFQELEEEYSSRLFAFTLFPMLDIHLQNSRLSMGAAGSYKNLILFTLIGVFILLIACVNYINMSTARSSVRSKEVGIRKALGSHRKSIVQQFLVESQLITFLALLLALGLAATSLTYFNQLTGRSFGYAELFTEQNILILFALLVLVGLLAGTYPAYVISNFSPLKALRGHLQQGGKKGLRSVLVAFQFAISVFLVATTIVVYQQLRFMQSQKLGINIDQVLVIENGMQLGSKYDVFKTNLESIPEVEVVGKASNLPFRMMGDWSYLIPDDNNRSVDPLNTFMSPESVDILDIEMVAGRFFDPSLVTDTSTVVINQALAEELGFDDPLGKKLDRGMGLEFRIIGVMKNFNVASLKNEIPPVIFRHGSYNVEVEDYHQSFILAKVSSENILATLEKVENQWNQLVTEYPFEASFMNDSFQRQYDYERKFGQVFTTFSILAIFIALLGLIALTTFVLQKRVKEIAVRKVLGASVQSLIRLVIKDFTRLVLLGSIVGVSAAFYWLSTWLEEYSYRIDLTWYLLVIPMAIILLLTWIVVSVKSYGAAVSNPSAALKEE